MKFAAFLTLFSLLLSPAIHAQDLVVSPEQLESSLALIRSIYAKPLSRRILSDSFKGLLVEGQKDLTETQLLLFLSENEAVEKEVKVYLAAVDREEAEHAKRLQKIIRRYEKELKLKVESVDLNRLLVRTGRGRTPEAAIARFLKGQSVPEAKIEEIVAELKQLDAALDEALKPLCKKYTEMFRTYLQDPSVLKKFHKYSDPSQELLIKPNDGSKGYEVSDTYVNHPTRDTRGNPVPERDIENEGYIRFIEAAKYKYAANIFEVDLPSYAGALASRTDLLERKQGIDKSNYDAREEVRDVYDTLVKGGVKTTLVITSKLNHPKIAIRDYGYRGLGHVLLSTGNATQSCVGKEGDLLNLVPLAPESRPNSNLAVLIKSDLLASVGHHEVSKSVDLLFKGNDFPVGGIYRFKGEGMMSIAFTPNGANNSIARNFYGPVIRNSKSRHLGGVFFVMSGRDVPDEIVAWGVRVYKSGETPLPMLVFHRGFSMQPWAGPLILSGLKLIGSKEDGTMRYVDDPDSPLVRELTKEQLAEWRSRIRIASRMFQDGVVYRDGVAYPYSVKTHDKLLTEGDLEIPEDVTAILSSYNPSENAEGNQEYAAKFVGDRKVARMAAAVVKFHYEEASLSVYDEAMRRNRRLEFDDYRDPDVDKAANRKVGRAKPEGKVAEAFNLKTKGIAARSAPKALDSGTDECNAIVQPQ